MRLIDVDALLLRIDLHGTNKFGMLDEDIREFIGQQSTIDAVQVVRCKDCKYLFNGTHDYCCCCHSGLARIDENSFCSHGVRRK